MLEARAKCAQVRAVRTAVSLDKVVSLLSACIPAVSSPELVVDLCCTVQQLCMGIIGVEVNRVTCGAAGAIPTLRFALCEHYRIFSGGAAVVTHVFTALLWLAHGNQVNADAITLSASGLGVILEAMTAHAGDSEAQCKACDLLEVLADWASPAALRALRDGQVEDAIHAAIVTHAKDGRVQIAASVALAAIQRERVAKPKHAIMGPPQPRRAGLTPRLLSVLSKARHGRHSKKTHNNTA